MPSNKIFAIAGLIALFSVAGSRADDVVGPPPDHYRKLDQNAAEKIAADTAAAAKTGGDMLPQSAWMHEETIIGATKAPAVVSVKSSAGRPGSTGIALVPPTWKSNVSVSSSTSGICPSGYSADTTTLPSFVYFPIGHPGVPPPNTTDCVQVTRNSYTKANVYTTLRVNNDGSSYVFAGNIGQPAMYGEILQFVQYDNGALDLYINYFVATPADAAILTSNLSSSATVTYDKTAPNPAAGIQVQILIPQHS
jgi:hypothetical protein